MSRFSTLPIEVKLGLGAWAALLVLQLIWHGWWFPPQHLPTWVVLAFTVIPLLLPLFALRNATRALLWVGILSLFYFCHGVAETWSSPSVRWLALIEVILTLFLIGTLGAGVKRKPQR